MNCRNRLSKFSRGGFTLVELLVAITILGLLMGAAFGSLRIGSRSFAAAVARADQVEDGRVTGDLLRRQFSQLVPLRWLDGDEERLAFAGTDEYVQFVAPAPEASAYGGLLAVSVTAAQQPDQQSGRHELWVGVGTFDPGRDQWQMPVPFAKTRLAADLDEVSISYFGIRDERGIPQWHESWPADSHEFPQAVRVSLHQGEDVQREWTYLFRIHAGAHP